MVLPGCLAVIILPVVGALIGHWWGGSDFAMRGATYGLGAGLAVFAFLVWTIRHVKKD